MKNGAGCVYDFEGKRKYLTKSEGVEFVKFASRLALRQRLFCQTMYYTGCRISEALALGPEALDVEQSVLRVRCLKKRGKIVFRRIPIPPSLTSELKVLSSECAEGRFWTFSRFTGRRIIKKLLAEAGIVGIQACPRGLRHSFGIRGALGRVPVTVIQKWMGHSHPQTTAIYLDVQDEEQRELIAVTWNLT